ncbi:HAD-like protein, partial [Ascodesmis nigricans]
PVPTESYLSIAKQPLRRLEKPNRLLVVLDLNGTLMYRIKHSTRPIMRPDLPEFLTYLFNNFEVMVWTSAQTPNALRMVRAAFTPEWIEKLRAVWSRDTLGLSNADFYSRVQVYKRLERIWTGRYQVDARTAEEIRNNVATTTHFWDQSNTILIDDSILKASAQPHNLIEVPSMVALDEIEKEDKVLNHVMAYLEEVKYYDNVSAYM